MTSNHDEKDDIYKALGDYLEDWKRYKAKAEAKDATYRDIEWYHWFCKETYQDMSKTYLTLDKKHTQELVGQIIASAKDQMLWAAKKLKGMPKDSSN